MEIPGKTMNNDALLKYAFILFVSFVLSFFVQEFFDFNTILLTIGVIFIVSLSFISPRFALLLIIFSTLLSPEISLGQVPFHGARMRAVVVRFEDILLIIVTISWLAQIAITKKAYTIPNTPLFKHFSLFLLITLLATLKGAFFNWLSPATGFFYFLKITEYFLLYLMVANNLKNTQQIKMYTAAFLLVALIVCIYCSFQVGIIPRISAPFEGEAEPNTLGGYFIIILGVSIGLALYVPSTRKKVFYLSLSGLLISLSFHTQSRATYAGIVPLFLTFLVIGRNRRAHIIAGILIILLLFAINALVIPGVVTTRIKHTFKADQRRDTPEVGFRKLDTSSMDRVYKAMEIVKFWMEEPILGYGLMGRGFIDGQYIRILAESGLMGMMAFIWLMGSLFKKVRETTRITTNDPFAQGLSVGFTAALVGIMVHAIPTNSILIIIRIAEPLWFLAAMVMMYPKLVAIPDRRIYIKEND